jgi:hypothetical protein
MCFYGRDEGSFLKAGTILKDYVITFHYLDDVGKMTSETEQVVITYLEVVDASF